MSGPLLPRQVIARKRDGAALSREEIGSFVAGATSGAWTDYQLSALLMAIVLRGMTLEETLWLTEAMMRSGTVADLSSIGLPKADKHSTGGVGDKLSLHLAPMVAACGIAVPMISGRSLGHTGGTLDKLEAIPGMRVGLSISEYRDQVAKIGLALVGQTDELVPADRKLYALRDVTATVESIPLICASILSKKLAEGIDVLVLDVKFGRGAFMKDPAQARELATVLVSVCKALGKPACALLTAMDQPLGRTVGNALEVAESIDCLKGRGPSDVMEVTFALGEQMMLLSGVVRSASEARTRLESGLSSGAALGKFRQMVQAQGGNPEVIDDPSLLPQARLRVPFISTSAGFVQRVDALLIASAALRLGAGRTNASDRIDPSAGLSQLAKEGEWVEAGAVLCIVHSNGAAALAEAQTILKEAFVLGAREGPSVNLVGERIG